jgi:hypothetical protein
MFVLTRFLPARPQSTSRYTVWSCAGSESPSESLQQSRSPFSVSTFRPLASSIQKIATVDHHTYKNMAAMIQTIPAGNKHPPPVDATVPPTVPEAWRTYPFEHLSILAMLPLAVVITSMCREHFWHGVQDVLSVSGTFTTASSPQCGHTMTCVCMAFYSTKSRAKAKARERPITGPRLVPRIVGDPSFEPERSVAIPR